MESSGANEQRLYQNVVVMRHGDPIDNFDPHWASTADRPWDPPLIDAGKARAFSAGRLLRSHLGFPIHRVFVSPFLRCLQTATEVVSGLCSGDHLDPNSNTSDGVKMDPSKLKVSVEFGLCEMLNMFAIKFGAAPPDGNFGFSVSHCESMLPSGTVDCAVERLYQELPDWETLEGARARYAKVIKALADKYPLENLLLVTHGEAIGVSVSAFMKNTEVYNVEYCGYSHLQRPITYSKDQSITAGEFEVITPNCQTGIGYLPLNELATN